MLSRKQLIKFAITAATIALYLVLLLVPFGTDIWDYFEKCPRGELSWSQKLSEAPFGYQRLTTSSRRPPRAHSVKIISLAKGQEPDDIFAPHLCRQRVFVSKLLERVESFRPAVIVIDKYFSSEGCEEKEPNERLRNSVATSPVPIIIGLQTLTGREIERDERFTAAEKNAIGATCLMLAPYFKFDDRGFRSTVKYGLIRLNHDTRKIPLQWSVYGDPADLDRGTPSSMASLSLATAEQFQQGMPHARVLDELLSQGKHPFTGFLREIPTISAIEVLCGKKPWTDPNWENCQGKDLPVDNDLQNRIVIIGEFGNELDLHESVIGEISGVVLQANYVESLLDDRFLSPVNKWISLLVNLIWVVIVELCFANSSSPTLGLFYSLVSLLVLAAICYLLVLDGYFLPVWVQKVWLGLIVVRWAQAAQGTILLPWQKRAH